MNPAEFWPTQEVKESENVTLSVKKQFILAKSYQAIMKS
jgi:hypothetical protein